MTERVVLAEQFAEKRQQADADRLGMWLFLGTEIMMFGGIFLAIAVIRFMHPEGAAEATDHLKLPLGAANTAVLFTSALTMTLAVLSAREGRRRPAVVLMFASAALGLAFLGVKTTEYYLEYREGLMPGTGKPFPLDAAGSELFMNVYFVGTGLHFLHLSIGIALISVLAGSLATGRARLDGKVIAVELASMYWHLIDVVWIFLFSSLYLM